MVKCRMLVSVAMLFALLGFSAADDKKETKIDKTKLPGVWKFSKGETKFPSPPVITLTKDGKLEFKLDINGKELVIKGTYEWKGTDSIKIAMTLPGGDEKKEEVLKITSLTDKEVVFVDEKNQKDTFVREVEKKKEK